MKRATTIKIIPKTPNANPEDRNITIKTFNNTDEIYQKFMRSDVTLLDLRTCSYLKPDVLLYQKSVDKNDLGINALVSFIGTKFNNDELVLKKFKDPIEKNARQIINEIIASILLTREYFNAITPLFTIGRTFASFVCNGFGYMILEKYDAHLNPTNFKRILGRHPTNHDLLFVIMQVLVTLKALQKKYQFTHYDLHSGNILIKKLTETDEVVGNQINKSTCLLTFNGVTFEFPKPEFIVKIIDFGYTRMKYGNKIISNPKFNTNYDPFYDVVYFLNNIASSFKNTNQEISDDIDDTISFVKFDKHYRPIVTYSDESLEHTMIYSKMLDLIRTHIGWSIKSTSKSQNMFDIRVVKK